MSVWSNEKITGGKKGLHLHVDLHGDADKAMSFLKTFPKQAPGCVARTLNKTITGARTDIVRIARATYNVKAGAVRDKMTLRKARSNYKTAALHVVGYSVPLYSFGTRPKAPRPKRPPKVGASVLVRQTTGRKKIPGSFVADLPTRGRSLYYRPGKDRDVVRKLFALSVPQMVDDESSVQKVEDGMQERFNKAMDHEIERFFQKKGLR